MINNVFFSEFRALRSVEIPLRSLTVIVGPNASGKSTILKGLQLLLEVVRTPNSVQYFSAERHPLLLASRGTQGTTRVGVETQSGTVSFEFRIPKGVSYDAIHQQAGMQQNYQVSVKSSRHPERKWVNVQEDPDLLAELPEARLLKLEPAKLASASSPGYSTDIDEQGEGLASALWLLHGKEYETFKKLEKHLCAVIPIVERIRFDRIPAGGFGVFGPPPGNFGGGGLLAAPKPGQAVRGGLLGGLGAVGETLLFDTKGAEGVPAECMSDGTLLVLGLLTVLYTTNHPRLILLDDLERGLHPKAQRQIVPLLRNLLKTAPDLQIVATSHSPYLVDVLQPEEVRLTSTSDDGSVSCLPLQDHPEFDRWKGEMSPGEFWSAVGEKWIAGQTPQNQ